MNGKGDTPRPVKWDQYGANYDRIFGRKPKRKAKPATTTADDALEEAFYKFFPGVRFKEVKLKRGKK